MPKHRVNRGQMRAARKFSTAKQPVEMSRQHAQKDERVRLSWSAPVFPGAFAHVIDVFDQHGTTTLTLCLERHKHLVFNLPLHDVFLTQHPPYDPHANIKRKSVTQPHRLDVEAKAVRRYMMCNGELIKNPTTNPTTTTV